VGQTQNWPPINRESSHRNEGVGVRGAYGFVQYSPISINLAQELARGCGVRVGLGRGVFSGVSVEGAKVT
jgi:hypothetical protein